MTSCRKTSRRGVQHFELFFMTSGRTGKARDTVRGWISYEVPPRKADHREALRA